MVMTDVLPVGSSCYKQSGEKSISQIYRRCLKNQS
jgi:hypothetical protein